MAFCGYVLTYVLTKLVNPCEFKIIDGNVFFYNILIYSIIFIYVRTEVNINPISHNQGVLGSSPSGTTSLVEESRTARCCSPLSFYIGINALKFVYSE